MGKTPYEAPNKENERIKGEWIALKYLHPYRTAAGLQRPVDPAWVERLKKDFTIEAIGQLCAAPGSGRSFGVFFGQHRMLTAKAVLGEDYEVLVQVYRGYTPQQLADIAIKLDTSKKWRAVHAWMRREVAGDTKVLRLNSIMAKHGISVGAEGRAAIKAVEAVETLFNRYGDEVLDQALGVLSAAYGRVSCDAYQGMFMHSTVRFLATNAVAKRDVDLVRLARKMKKACTDKDLGDPTQLIKEAKAGKDTAKVPVIPGLAAKIARIYNWHAKETESQAIKAYTSYE